MFDFFLAWLVTGTTFLIGYWMGNRTLEDKIGNVSKKITQPRRLPFTAPKGRAIKMISPAELRKEKEERAEKTISELL